MGRTYRKGAMRGWKNRIVVGLFALGVVLAAAPVASASDARSPGQLRAEIRRLENQLSQKRYVLRETEAATKLWGLPVGRWVWLAKDCGWENHDIKQLMYIINRESRGNPNALNESSGAAGLLQFMPQWYHGMWRLPPFDPFNPRTNLRMGLRLHKMQGWSPWAM